MIIQSYILVDIYSIAVHATRSFIVVVFKSPIPSSISVLLYVDVLMFQYDFVQALLIDKKID